MAGHSEAFLKLVNEAKSRIQETTVKKVSDRMKQGEKLLIVDCREESEWNAGRIPGSIYLGKGVIERDIEKKIPDQSAEIIIYCGGGYRSALAAESLLKMGYQRPVSMDGGIRGWMNEGLPIENSRQ